MGNFETAVRDEMNDTFGEDDLIFLVDDLGLDWENLSGDTNLRKVGSIIKEMKRDHRLDDLISKLREQRPNSTWPDPPTETEKKYDKAGVDLDKAISNYLGSLRQEVGVVPIFGRPQHEPIENVFTDVYVLDQPQAEQRYDIQALKSQQKDHDRNVLRQQNRISGQDVIASYSKLFVLGKPGAGKTTFLKYTALQAINGKIDKIPIFVSLKELSDSGKSINEFIAHLFKRHRFADAEKYIQTLLENGEVLILFDGLDEVNIENDARKILLSALKDFVIQFSDCSILVSSRVTPPNNVFAQFEFVEMADFDEEQIKAYIGYWFGENRNLATQCEKDILQADKNNGWGELANVPLLLSLLCLVYQGLSEFPRKRSDLYEEAVQALLTDWDEERDISRDAISVQLSVSKIEDLYAYLAFHTFEKNELLIKERRLTRLVETYLQDVLHIDAPNGRKVLQKMKEQHGLLMEQARRIYAFSHLTVQEYFTARYIIDHGLEQQLMTHVGDERWNVVFLLVVEILDDATEFCEQYLQTLETMIAVDKQIFSIMSWIEYKQKQLNLDYKDEAVRAYLLFQISGLTKFRYYNTSVDLHRYLDEKLSFALEFLFNFSFMPVYFNDKANARYFKSMINYAQELADKFDLFVLKRDLDVDFGVDKNGLDNLAGKRQLFKDIVQKSEPKWNPNQQMIITKDELGECLDINEEQAQLLTLYLEANLLLIRCIEEIADVFKRQVIKSQVLLPPS